MKFNIEDYKGNYAMHCKTKEEAEDFCRYLDSVGRKWHNGRRYTECSCWVYYKSETCYDFNDSSYCGRDYYIENEHQILEWSDFMSDSNKFTKSDLKSGDVILRRDGSVEIVCLETGTLISISGFDKLSEVNDDLTFMDYCNDYDIIAVRRPKQPYECQFCAFDRGFAELVYERKDEPEEMTLEEVCKALGKEIKIVKEH